MPGEGKETDVWFIRGVPISLREEVKKHASALGMKLGPFVSKALRAALERPATPELSDRVAVLERELAELRAKVEALAGDGARNQAGNRPARSLASLADLKRPRERGGGPRNWVTQEDREEIVRLWREEPSLTQAAIAKRVGRAQSTVSAVLEEVKHAGRAASATGRAR